MHIYILKDNLHVIEMRNIVDNNIGYAYGFRYRDVSISDKKKLKESKSKDDFAKTSLERSKLEYRYERIDSYNNPTTININVGDKVCFKADGEITLGFFAGSSTPDGIDGYTSYKRIQDFRHGSLLYKIGTGSWNAVTANEKIFVAKSSGILEFIVNDNDSSNNSGQFRIDIKIIRSQ